MTLDTKLVPVGKTKDFRIFYGDRAVGCVSGFKDAPINWLPKACSGVELDSEEKIEVARAARSQLNTIVEAQEESDQELLALTNPGLANADQGTDPQSDNDVQDQDG